MRLVIAVTLQWHYCMRLVIAVTLQWHYCMRLVIAVTLQWHYCMRLVIAVTLQWHYCMRLVIAVTLQWHYCMRSASQQYQGMPNTACISYLSRQHRWTTPWEFVRQSQPIELHGPPFSNIKKLMGLCHWMWLWYFVVLVWTQLHVKNEHMGQVRFGQWSRFK